MIHVLMESLAASPGGDGLGSTGTFFAIFASAVIVIGGLAALVRAIWRVSTAMRDNTLAVRSLTTQLNDLAVSVDGRFDKLADRVAKLEWNARQAESPLEKRHHGS
jgi:hypothetical protein